MKTSEEIGKIASALAKAQSELINIKTDAKNDFFKSKYAPLGSFVQALREVLPKHGLSYTQTVYSTIEGAGVETMLMHESGEWIRGDPFFLPASKIDPQGFGSCITYARRYSLAAITGTAPENDDDAEAMVGKTRTTAAKVLAGKVHPNEEAWNAQSDESKAYLRTYADEVIRLFDSQGDVMGYFASHTLDAEEKMALWHLLQPRSDIRAAVTKSFKEINQKEARNGTA